MQTYVPGQRWISDAELEMGLGTVFACDHRTVTILFLSTGETRVYARDTAPLRRVLFSIGEIAPSHEGWKVRVSGIREHKGLLAYVGKRTDTHEDVVLEETHLDNFIQMNRPAERLFAGVFDHNKQFDLRKRTLQHANRLGHSELQGLAGGRTSLIPHQLYIAFEVAKRFAPRVLLADEVGLGKTIEAGMIIHQQLLSQLAQRVLIVVPESLVHQWLVEMLRRFNLQFSIFDEDRCHSFDEDEEDNCDNTFNPFDGEQLVLCSLDFLRKKPKHYQQLLNSEWDLLVVDEAHHLHWSEEAPSPAYVMIEALSKRIPGVLLLTATPEQLGKEGHFARLRLLDPDRYANFSQFEAEEANYQPIADAVEALLDAESEIDATTQKTLVSTFEEGDNAELINQLNDPEQAASARLQLVEHLLDRHGTGRVLFRNTRAAIKGFPERKLSAYELPLPDAYRDALAGEQKIIRFLSPELCYRPANDEAPIWTDFDPRVKWLADKLKQLDSEKVLVIMRSALSAIELSKALQNISGIYPAVFHEKLSIVERDRAAAYFADQQAGTQVLLCSEIGSEGRNFQFAHHLVLFDLPFDPDLLEQRIGRLDRIGQTETIQIHVPYLNNTPQALLWRWYHQSLDAFEHTCPAGQFVFSQVKDALTEVLLANSSEDLDPLIATTQHLYNQKKQELDQGRNRLLEYSSCRKTQALALVEQAEEDSLQEELQDYLEHIYDCYGVDMEEHATHSFLISQGDKMQYAFPHLQEEGMIITCDRATALANEDMHFITWEHPMVSAAMDMVLSCEQGNSSIAAIKGSSLRAGNLLLEAVFVLEGVRTSELNLKRYLPVTSIRIVVDVNGKDVSTVVSDLLVRKHSTKVDKGTSAKIVKAYAEPLRAMLNSADKQVRAQAPELLGAAHQKAKGLLEREINRLEALRKVNPNVREEEINFFEGQWKALDLAIENILPRLDALRILVTV